MGIFKTIPQQGLSGLSVASAASAWGFGAWQTLLQNCPELSVIGLTLQFTAIPSVDTTEEVILEIGTGAVGAETTKLQFPYSFRSDTAVGFYRPWHFFLPEPLTVAANTRVAVRFADTSTSARTYNGVRIRIDELTPFGPNPPGVDITQQALQRSAVI